MPSVFIGGWSCKYPLPSGVFKYLVTVSQSDQLGNGRNTPEVQVRRDRKPKRTGKVSCPMKPKGASGASIPDGWWQDMGGDSHPMPDVFSEKEERDLWQTGKRMWQATGETGKMLTRQREKL